MKITYITGSSGSGKSEKIYRILLEISKARPEKQLFLIVPEQFTMQAQKNIVAASPEHGTFNIDIVSFNRLAYRVFEELGISLLTTIDDTGKNLILRKVIDENRRNLRIIKPKDSQGFVSEIKSVISELLQYSVSMDMLSAVCERISTEPEGINHNERLRLKLQDIMVIYKGFREYISEKYITTEEITQILCDHIGSSRLVQDSIIAFDGFTGFTPVQYRLIELLFDKAEHMYFTVTMPKQAQEQLFGMSFDMLRRLGTCADRSHILTETCAMEGEVPYRFMKTPELAHLERSIFREEKVYPGEAEGILIYSAFGKKAELAYVASRIKSLVRQGYRYKDMGVIASSMEDYRELIANTFLENGIPAFMDNKRSILANPAVEYIRSALSVMEKDYSYESVFRLLKGYMCPIGREETDLLENYVLALGIRGHKRWSEKFHRKYSSKREVDLAALNEIREKVMGLTEELYQVFHAPESLVEDYVKALNAFLDASQVYEKLEVLKEEMIVSGNAARAKEYGQSYGDIMKLFEQTANLLGTEKMGIRQFCDVLDAGFNEIKVGIVPPTIDMVMVGDVERTRLDHVKIIFFVGVNEGLVPKSNSNRGLFSEAERELLCQQQLELSPTCRQKAYMQNFYLYLLLTKPSDQLIFTVNREEKASKLIGSIREMFPKARVLSDEEVRPVELICNGRDGMQYLFGQMGEEKELHDKERALFLALWQDLGLRKKMKELADTGLRNVTEERITREAARRLYGEIVTGSVSRMETYASCAFAHFAKYGLELEERRLYELGAADLGTLFHEALRVYSMELARDHHNFATVPEEERRGYIKEAVEYALTDYNNSIFADNSRNAYMREKISGMLERTAWALGEQVKAGSFEPKEFEREFVFEQDGMKIRGKIDRIDYALDQDASYVKIIDYKSGKKTLDYGKLYDGLQLQLLVYLESMSKEHIPAAAMYYSIDNPIVDYEPDMAEQNGGVSKTAAQAAILQALRPNGIVNGEIKAVELLDGVTKEGRSSCIPVAYNKDGSLSKNSQATTESRIRLLGMYAVKKMTELGREIGGGRTAPNPYQGSCDFCPYGFVCGFHEGEDGCSYRRPSKLKNDDESFALFAERVKN